MASISSVVAVVVAVSVSGGSAAPVAAAAASACGATADAASEPAVGVGPAGAAKPLGGASHKPGGAVKPAGATLSGWATALANGSTTSPMLCTWLAWMVCASGWRLCQATTRVSTSLSRSACMMRLHCWRLRR